MAESQDFRAFCQASQKKCYEIFGCSMFDSYDGPNGLNLLRLKICFIFFGMPQEDGADNFENAYSEKQKKEAEKIVKMIKHVIDKSGTPTISVGVIFVCGKSEDKFLSVPVFRIRISPHADQVTTKFIDQNSRVYKNWNHWKSTNHLPAGEYCYPKNGFYTCMAGAYAFDSEKEPILEFGKSPSSKPISKILRVCDTAMGPIMIGGTVILVVGLPFAGVDGAIGVVGGTFTKITKRSFYRAAQRLYDKATHEESLTDVESLMLWTAVISTPLCFITGFANARLILCTEAGQKFIECSQILRYSVTILNYAKIGVNAVGVALSVVSMVKNFQKRKPSNLELLQFSLRLFCLCHTLMQPVVAKNVYIKAQNLHLQNVGKNLTDADAKAAFDDILKNNDSMDSKADVIRALNVITDADLLFKEAGLNIKSMESCEDHVQITYNNGTEKMLTITPRSHETINTIIMCIENTVIRPCREMIKVDDSEMSLFSKCFENETVRASIIKTAEGVATEIGLASIFYLGKVLIQVARSSNSEDIIGGLNAIQTCANRSFLMQLRHDLEIIARIAKTFSLAFLDQMMAVYYFRQFGANFPNIINSNVFHFYINAKMPNYIAMEHRKKTENLNDSSAFDLFARDQKFTVVVKKQEKQLLIVTFFKEGTWEEIAAQFKQIHDNQNCLPFDEAKTQMCQTFGLDSVTIFVSKENQTLPLELRNDLEDYYKSKICWLLTAIGTQ